MGLISLFSLLLTRCGGDDYAMQARNLVKKWQKAHNAHDINALQNFYAPLVVYYLSHYQNSEVLKSKTQYFKPNSDYKIDIVGDIRTETPAADVFVCIFRTKASFKGKEIDADFALTFKKIDNQLKVIEELDEISFNNQVANNELLKKAYVANYFGGKINQNAVANENNQPTATKNTGDDSDEINDDNVSEGAEAGVAAARNDDGYGARWYADASEKYLSKYELDVYVKAELRLMRNEIFAAHGYIFKAQDLQAHFGKMSWYRPSYENVDNLLTEIEKANIKLIKTAEKTAEVSFSR